MTSTLKVGLGCLLAGCCLLSAGGCENGQAAGPQPTTAPAVRPILGPTTAPALQPVPSPLDLLLPREIRIHPFTGTRTFDKTGGIRGIDVRVEAIDAYGDTTKAFGDFRFELYTFTPNSEDNKGVMLATWDVSLSQPRPNLIHWDKITRTYKFKLQWDQAIPVGQKFVLVAVLSSPYTPRLFAQRAFVSGQ